MIIRKIPGWGVEGGTASGAPASYGPEGWPRPAAEIIRLCLCFGTIFINF